MAAPFVTGAVALAKQMFPNASAPQLVQLVLATARDLGAPGVDAVFGHGLLAIDNIVATKAPAAASVYAYGAWNDFLMFDGLGRLALGRASGWRDEDAPAAGQAALGFAPGSPAGAAFPNEALSRPGLPVWASMGASLAVADASGGISGATGHAFTGQIGVDLIQRGPFSAGLSIGLSRGSVSSGGNSAATTAPNVMAYASLAGETAFADLYGGAAWLNRSITRSVLAGTSGTIVGASGASASANGDDLGWFVGGKLGGVFALPQGRIEPYVHAAFRQQAFSRSVERGSGVFALTVGGDPVNETEFGAGLTFSGAWSDATESGFHFRPVVDVSYARFVNDSVRIPAAVLGSGFSGSTARLGADQLSFSGRFVVRSADSRLQLFLGAEASLRANAHSIAANGGLSWRF